MYKIYYYKNKKGEEPVVEYLKALSSKNDKDSRIKLNKIRDYVKALSEHGLTLGEPYIKHIDGDIWELRPVRDRILFAVWNGDGFILLHFFMKQTQKTPSKEIEQARSNLNDYRNRSDNDEK